jgi:hypothetical protein
MFRKDESHQRDPGSGRHQKDAQAPGIMAGQASAPAQNDRANKDRRVQHRLFYLSTPRV